jgi:hypothetical protein
MERNCNEHGADAMTLEKLTPSQLAELETHVQRRLKSRVRDLRLSQRDTGLVLEGSAASYYVKQLAQHLVMKAIELPICANEIEVH